MHHSLLSREITFLHFFSWNFISFGQKEPIKVQNFWLMTAHVKLHQICALRGSFRWNYIKFQLKKVWRIYITWHWKVIQNLKKSWFAVSKMKRVWWILFEVSSQISQNFPFDWFLFCKVPNLWLKKVQRSYLTWHWRVMQKFEEKMTCGLQNDARSLPQFHQSTWKCQNWDFDGILLSKVENEWP